MISDLTSAVSLHCPPHQFANVLEYALFPPGKLFRPSLVHAIAKDLGVTNNDHRLLASFVEIHHAYTLVHDDLPAMDNDDFRRGRPSTHKKFNEWNAILAGDALLNASFGLLSKISPAKLPWLLKFTSWATGSKGLILGQVMDMGLESQNSFSDLLKMHELKTSRLIQLCIVGSYFLSKDLSITNYKHMMQLGNSMGITFQLIDDLKEVALDEVNEHELSVNPYFHYGEKAVVDCIKKNIKLISKICEQYNLINTQQMFDDYLKKSKEIINQKIKM